MSDSKECFRCKTTFNVAEFCVRKNRKGAIVLGSYCRRCQNERTKEWQKSNPARVREFKRAWRSNNVEKCAQHRKSCYERNPSAYRERERLARTELKTSYVRKVLANGGMPAHGMSPEIVEIKKTQLSLKRLTDRLIDTAKELGNEHKES